MRPTNRIMCPDCGKPKMLFETERKANDFIKWNGDELEHGSELRAYYCPSCCGWHISHQKYKYKYDNSTKRLIGAFERSGKNKDKLDRLIHYDEFKEEARQLFDELPEKIRTISDKSILRRYLTQYFANKGIKDDGSLRTAIYVLWKKQFDDLNQEKK